MLWYKAWLETRWRFLIGFGILTVLSIFTARSYPAFLDLLQLTPQVVDPDSVLGRRIAEGIALNSTFKGYIWSQWFLKNLPQTWILFAALLGAGGLLAQVNRGEGLFTLSMPVSRTQIAAVRAGVCLGQLFVIALVPSLLVSAVAPTIGERFPIGDAIVHALCLFVAGSVFFSLSFLLSTIFHDVWRPFLIVLCLSVVEQTIRDTLQVGLYRLMSAERYFRGDGIPWLALAGAAGVTAIVLYGATRNLERRDF